jgi:hypothetical protein
MGCGVAGERALRSREAGVQAALNAFWGFQRAALVIRSGCRREASLL